MAGRSKLQVGVHEASLSRLNDGSKPVPAADYESSLAIRVQGGASFVRARVTGRSPKDIDAEIATDKQSLSLKPTLLNPKDTITVTAITSGTVPVFDSKARIVGVSSIALVDGTLEKSGTAKRSFLLAAATLLLVASMIVFDGATESRGILLRQRAAAYVGLVSAFPGVFAFMSFLEELGIQGFWYFMLYIMLLLIPVALIAFGINRKPAPAEEAQVDGKP